MIKTSLLVLASLILGASIAQAEKPPNVVMIISDDLGYLYTGLEGNRRIATPHLDQLAADGFTFRNTYSSASVCGPALRTLLTGLHQRSWVAQRNRIEELLGEPSDPEGHEIERFVTPPRMLDRAGYTTFQAGKHWESSYKHAGYHAGDATGEPFQFGRKSFVFGRENIDPMNEFLDGLEEDEPFFMFLAPKLPHTPHNPSPALKFKFQRMGLPDAAVRYYAQIERFDMLLGQILANLESRGLREDTLIIYASDNGWEQGPFQQPSLFSNLIGGDRGKLSLYDLGFRTPLIFSWPGKIDSNTVVDDLVTFQDVHATVLDYAGAPIPPDHEGITLVPQIEGWGEPQREFVAGNQDVIRATIDDPGFWFLRQRTGGFVRTDEWHYVEVLETGEQELYWIKHDPLERNNLGPRFPDLLGEFSQITEEWRERNAARPERIDLIGTLENENGERLSDLKLSLKRIEGKKRKKLRVISDSEGFFRFPNIPAGKYRLAYETESRGHVKKMKVNLTGYETGPFLPIVITERP